MFSQDEPTDGSRSRVTLEDSVSRLWQTCRCAERAAGFDNCLVYYEDISRTISWIIESITIVALGKMGTIVLTIEDGIEI